MKNIYQHFRKVEYPFIDKVYDWVAKVDAQYIPYLTPFLNPREIHISMSILGQFKEIKYQKYGGYGEAERKRMLIYPAYYMPDKEDFELCLFEISYPSKFISLSHGSILGSILGTGISRDKLGDILNQEGHWQFIVDKNLENYILMNLKEVGNTPVQLKKKKLSQIIDSRVNWNDKEIIVSSLRLDTVLSKSLNLSRKQVNNLFLQRKIKLNWAEETQEHILVEISDVISVRGYGRIQIGQVKNKTRKDNYVLEIKQLNRNN